MLLRINLDNLAGESERRVRFQLALCGPASRRLRLVEFRTQRLRFRDLCLERSNLRFHGIALLLEVLVVLRKSSIRDFERGNLG